MENLIVELALVSVSGLFAAVSSLLGVVSPLTCLQTQHYVYLPILSKPFFVLITFWNYIKA